MIYHKGRKALEELAVTDNYVFHGSQNGTLKILIPIAGGIKRYNSKAGTVSIAKKFVYATKHIDLAIFTAAIWRRYGASGFTTPGTNSDEVNYEFHASPEAIAEAAKPDNVGYVYVLDKKSFIQEEENPHVLISAVSIEPYAVVEISALDLKPDFKTLTSPPRYD